jgi:hypothetical protein
MTSVTATEATAQTVTAACQCAAEISKVLRLHLEWKKFELETEKQRRQWAKEDAHVEGGPQSS